MPRHGTWTETGGGGPDFGMIAAALGVLFGAAVVLRVAAEVAKPLGELLITLAWITGGLFVTVLAVGLAWVVYRLNAGLPLRPRPRPLPVNRPDPAWRAEVVGDRRRQGPPSPAAPTVIQLPPGMDAEEVAEVLARAGLLPPAPGRVVDRR
jgi:hypothetical protein